MVTQVDMLVIGGGIAGLSAASRLARHGSVTVLERESAIGYHASGRSATFLHLGIGADVVRGLTAASRSFFVTPPDGFRDVPLAQPRPAMFIARAEDMDALAALEGGIRRFSDRIERIGPAAMQVRVPALRVGEGHFVAGLLDHDACKLDSDALLQAHARAVRAAGGRIVTDAEALAIKREGDRWIIDTAGESWSARTLINAAGAWTDTVAAMAGVRPLGLRPLRRTIIAVAMPDHAGIGDWPFVKTVSDDGFYMLPEAGRLLASPMDASPSEPVDAQAEDYDVAVAAWRVEEATTLKVDRIAARWAGLRSFLPDSNPAAGFDEAAPGFFWLAGQGGFGLQTSPAMSLATEALMLGLDWPEPLRNAGLDAASLQPSRLDR